MGAWQGFGFLAGVELLEELNEALVAQKTLKFRDTVQHSYNFPSKTDGLSSRYRYALGIPPG